MLALHVLVAHDRLQQGELLRRRQQQLVVGDAQPYRAALLAVEVAVTVDVVVAGHNGAAARARAVVGDGARGSRRRVAAAVRVPVRVAGGGAAAAAACRHLDRLIGGGDRRQVRAFGGG